MDGSAPTLILLLLSVPTLFVLSLVCVVMCTLFSLTAALAEGEREDGGLAEEGGVRVRVGGLAVEMDVGVGLGLGFRYVSSDPRLACLFRVCASRVSDCLLF